MYRYCNSNELQLRNCYMYVCIDLIWPCLEPIQSGQLISLNIEFPDNSFDQNIIKTSFLIHISILQYSGGTSLIQTPLDQIN